MELVVHSRTQIDYLDLNQASELTGLHREFIQELARARLVSFLTEAADDEVSGLRFDERGLLRLRQIARLRDQHRLNLRTVRMIVKLMDRLETAEAELRFLRDRTRANS